MVTVIMIMAVRKDVMGRFVITRRLKILGWIATAVMAIAVLVMFATWRSGGVRAPGMMMFLVIVAVNSPRRSPWTAR